jgi:hypothetical protein
VNGAFGGAAAFALLLAGAALAFAVGNGGLAPPSAFRYVTICQRCCSLKLAHDGIPLFGSPCVMNQKIAPSAALCVGPVASAGILPVPPPVDPWHAAQCRANKFAPACAAACLPADGFFVCAAAAGAPWKEAIWAFIGKQTPIAANKNADRDAMNADLLLLQLALLAAFKLPSKGLTDSIFPASNSYSGTPTRIILPLQLDRTKKRRRPCGQVRASITRRSHPIFAPRARP